MYFLYDFGTKKKNMQIWVYMILEQKIKICKFGTKNKNMQIWQIVQEIVKDLLIVIHKLMILLIFHNVLAILDFIGLQKLDIKTNASESVQDYLTHSQLELMIFNAIVQQALYGISAWENV
jgi:hypothetical protein